MTRLFLAVLALACACAPAHAAETVTYEALAGILGWIGFSFIALIVGGVVLAAVGGIILKAWSH